METNINGPSLFRAPTWLSRLAGRYLLYFGHHSGTYIRLAVADQLEGPWRIHKPAVLDLRKSGFIDHIASPEIFIDEEAKELRLYFDGRIGYNPDGNQIRGTRIAVSTDDLSFTVQEALIGPTYFPVFKHSGGFFLGLCWKRRVIEIKGWIYPV